METLTNLFANPSLEKNLFPWAAYAGSGAVISRTQEQAYVGSWSARVEAAPTGSVGGTNLGVSIAGLSIPEGETHTFHVALRFPSTNSNKPERLSFIFRDDAGNVSMPGGVINAPSKSDMWHRVSVSFTVPAGRTVQRAYFSLLNNAGWKTGDHAFFDAANTDSEHYFDGDTGRTQSPENVSADG